MIAYPRPVNIGLTIPSLDYNLGGGAPAFAAMHDKAGTASDLKAIGLNFAF